MNRPEIVAALRGIINSTSLNTLPPQVIIKLYKAEIRRLLEITNFASTPLLTTLMPKTFLTRYRLVVNDLSASST